MPKRSISCRHSTPAIWAVCAPSTRIPREQALSRFAHCVLTANVGLPHASTREAIGLAIHVVVHISRVGGARVVTQVVQVAGYGAPEDAFTLDTIYSIAPS